MKTKIIIWLRYMMNKHDMKIKITSTITPGNIIWAYKPGNTTYNFNTSFKNF